MIGSPSYICIASPLMISPLKRSAKSTASYLTWSVWAMEEGYVMRHELETFQCLSRR